MMTKQRIGQYISLKREISMLEDQIYDAGYAVDVVKGSQHEIPYAMHNVVIRGYTSPAVPKLRKRKAALEAECAVIEKYVEDIEDSAVRQLFIRRFIEGKGVAEAARLAGYSERQARRIINEKMSAGVR